MTKQQIKKLVIVESPTKAKTIRQFLGPEYIVESCMGHIRDLPSSVKELPEKFRKEPWARLGVNVSNNFQPVYRVPEDKKDIVNKLKNMVKSVQELILATDEDREGESIAWHLSEILTPKVPVKRMVFHEITKSAIELALKKFRKIDKNLVQAQEARRILDRLMGYSISPLLWKKVLWGLSAGRVQSVAMSLVSRREMERLLFKKTKYWDLEAEHKKNSITFQSHLIMHKGRRLVRSSDFDSVTGERKKLSSQENGTKGTVLLMNEKSAQDLEKQLKGKKFKVKEVIKKRISRKPSPPFITSTLQQECNRKFRFSSRQTMGLAQKLYEQGLITYMRTDSTFLSGQAVKAARSAVSQLYGKEYLPPTPRVYQTKSKGAQEAHEAIRPAGSRFRPPQHAKLTGDLLLLYQLIWNRTLASQMTNCIQNQVRIELEVSDCVFMSSGTTIEFPGFYKVYKDQETDEVRLPNLKKGDEVLCSKLKTLQHATKPPARYTEASLIQKLEKEGVGRPSTYASIIGTIQERGYVKKEKNSLFSTFTALVVDRLLCKHFPDYVSLSFTSQMEETLDKIALGKQDYIKYLNSVYYGKKGLKQLVATQEKKLEGVFFRSLNLKGFEEYQFNVGPFGEYVSTTSGKKEVRASLPTGFYPGDLTINSIEQLIKNKQTGGRLLGQHPTKKGQNIFVVSGRYGPYVEMKPASDGKKTLKNKTASSKAKTKPKTQKTPSKKVSLSPFYNENTINLEEALRLLELPKTLGQHPKTKKEIKKGVGPYGPYLLHDGAFRSIPADGFFEMNLQQAVAHLQKPKKKTSSQVLKEIGRHPDSGEPIQLMKGRYGPYIKYSKKNYSLSTEKSLDKLNLEKALTLITAGGTKSSKKRGSQWKSTIDNRSHNRLQSRSVRNNKSKVLKRQESNK